MSIANLQRATDPVTAPATTVNVSEFLLLSATTRSRNDNIKSWWKSWHDSHPYRSPPPSYVQYNPSYCPERAVTRHEFNVYDSVLSSLLRTFAEKKKVRTHDLDCIEQVRALKPSSSMTKDIIDILTRSYPEDHSTIVSNYKKLWLRVHELFDSERMLPQYVISYLREINTAIEEIGKPGDKFSKERELEVFCGVFDDAYYNLPESQSTDEYFREMQKLAKRLRKPDIFPDSDRYKAVMLGGIDKINTFLVDLGAEHNMVAPRPPQLIFVRHGAPAQADYVKLTEEININTEADDSVALPRQDERVLLNRLRSTPLAVAAAARGGVATPGRAPRPPARPNPYWTPAPTVTHPSAAGGGGNPPPPKRPPKPDGDEQARRRELLKRMITQRVAPPISTSNPIGGATTAAPGGKAPFPRKDSGKLIFPGPEFKTMNNLRRAFEDVDASSITDPKIKKLLNAASDAAALLNTETVTFEEPPPDTKPDAQSRALDDAIDNVLAIANSETPDAPPMSVDELGDMLDKVLGDATPRTEQCSMLSLDPELFSFDEQTYVQPADMEQCMTLATEKKNIVLFDSCASRCFEKDTTECIPGTYMELKVKPVVRQASATATGMGMALRHYNIQIPGTNTCVTVIGAPMIVPSFTNKLSIAGMDELAHSKVIIQGAIPPQLPVLNAISQSGDSVSLPLALTNTKMPYFVSIPDSVVISENITRLNTDMEPYTDAFAIDQILRNKEGLLASNLMRDNLKSSSLKAAYAECLDYGLFALSAHEPADISDAFHRVPISEPVHMQPPPIVVCGRMLTSSKPT